jgi:putative oxidoreductase
VSLLKWSDRIFDAIPYAPVALFLRVVAAHPFFVSGQTKIEGPTIGATILGWDMTMQLPLTLRDATIALFENEYKLPLISPGVAAHLTAGVEFLLPIMLAVGLATRLSAVALLAMTMVIQFFIYPDAWWSVHAYWAALLCALISKGPGTISLDHLLSARGRGD